MRNTAFHYLYRDGTNHVAYGTVVFLGVFTYSQRNRLTRAFESGEHFMAHQIGVPEVFLWSAEADYDPEDQSTWPENLLPGQYVIGKDDHCWHEFAELEVSELEPTDPRNFEKFVADVELAASQGWDEFDPKARAPKSVRDRLERSWRDL